MKRRLKIKAEKVVDDDGKTWYVLVNEYGEPLFGGFRFVSRTTAYSRFIASYPTHIWDTRPLRNGGYSIDITEVKEA